MIKINKYGEVEHCYRVQIEEGKFTGFNRAAFDKECRGLTGDYEWCLRKFKKRRSTEQNNVQFWYFTEIGNKTGDTPQRIKTLLDFKFLLVEELNEQTGEIEKRVKGTSELTTEEHNVYMQNIRDWAQSFLNLTLPLPDKNWKFNFD